MSRFRKKPIVVDAEQFDGTQRDAELLREWCMGRAMFVGGASKSSSPARWIIDIPAIGGTFRVEPGDWIVRGVNGEFRACKPDVFAATYERFEEEAR